MHAEITGWLRRTGYGWGCLFILCLCGGDFAHAQSTLTNRLHQADHIEGTFLQKRFISVLSVPLESSGLFTFGKESGVAWHTLEPIESLLQIDLQHGVLAGATADQLQQVTSSQVVADIFLGVLSGELERLAGLFSVTELPAEDGWRLQLTPHTSQLADQIASILVSGDEFVETVVLQEGNGDRTEIVLQVVTVK